MDSLSLFEESKAELDDLHPEPLEVARNLLTVGLEHWAHKSLPASGKVPKWLESACRDLVRIRAGVFSTSHPFDPDWLRRLAPVNFGDRVRLDWEEVNSAVIRAFRNMLRRPDYMPGTVFFPSRMDEWLVSTPPRKAPTSCFLRSLNAVGPEFDLREYSAIPPTEAAIVAQVKAALGPEEAARLEALHSGLERPVAPRTYWERVGKVAGWLQEHRDALASQFGEQEDRRVTERHGARLRMSYGEPWMLVMQIARWSHDVKGYWSGWVPVPGEPEWLVFVDWVASMHGVYLWPVSKEAVEHPSIQVPERLLEAAGKIGGYTP